MYIDSVYAPYLSHIKDGIVLDVGGNIGLFTQFAIQNGAKHVYIVEPAKDHLETIKKFIEFNEYKNVTVLPYALSHENGEIDLLHSKNVTAHSTLPGMNNAGTSEKVKTITIDKLMEENKIYRINFLKLDPEGSEGAIIGSDGFKKVIDKIDSLVVEMHSWGGYNYDQLVNTLRDYNFSLKKMPTEAYVVGGVKNNVHI